MCSATVYPHVTFYRLKRLALTRSATLHTVWNSYLKKRILRKTGISANSFFPKSSSISPPATKPLQRAQRHQLQICRTLDSNLVTRCVCCHGDAPRRPPACGRRGTRRRGFQSGCVYIWMYLYGLCDCMYSMYNADCWEGVPMVPWKRCLGSQLLCCLIARCSYVEHLISRESLVEFKVSDSNRLVGSLPSFVFDSQIKFCCS